MRSWCIALAVTAKTRTTLISTRENIMVSFTVAYGSSLWYNLICILTNIQSQDGNSRIALKPKKAFFLSFRLHTKTSSGQLTKSFNKDEISATVVVFPSFFEVNLYFSIENKLLSVK